MLPLISLDTVILHIDFDSFFASCEQERNPEFRRKPLGVTATNGRNCIIASSREAKKLGVRTGTRRHDAYLLSPDIILVPANFVHYFEVSKKFLNICKDYSPYVELFSIDELFMDVTKTAHLFGGVQSLIERIKKRIHDEIGEYITASVGISHNKLLAKLASGLKKPNGVFQITPSDIEQVYASAKLTDMCGIGERVKIRLNSIGVYTLLQLRDIPLEFLIAEFGSVEGRFLKNIGLASDDSQIISCTDAPAVKSVGRNYCLPKNEYDQRIILQNVYELSEEVGIKLRRLTKKARTVGLSLRGTRGEHGRKTIDTPLSSGRDIFSVCKYLYDSWHWNNAYFPENAMVRQISVWTGNLVEDAGTPLSIFENRIRDDAIQKTIDSINEKYGDHTIRNGFLLYADKLTTVPNGYMADTYERTKLAEELKL